MSAKYCLPVPVFHVWPELTQPAARSLCDSWATCYSISSASRAETCNYPPPILEDDYILISLFHLVVSRVAQLLQSSSAAVFNVVSLLSPLSLPLSVSLCLSSTLLFLSIIPKTNDSIIRLPFVPHMCPNSTVAQK